MNYYLLPLVALIPLVIGSIYYHPKVLGSAWMKANNFTTADLDGGKMWLIFGLAYFASLLLTAALMPVVIHQMGYISTMMEVEGYGVNGSEVMEEVKSFQRNYGKVGRNFGHGALHGILATIFLVVPIIGINALFERRSLKYVAIHVGYWLIVLALMGGVISQFLVLPKLL